MNKWHRRVSYAIIIAMCLPRGYIGGLRVAAVVVCIIPAMELAWALQLVSGLSNRRRRLARGSRW